MTNLSFKERLGRLARIRGAPLVPFGSSADVRLLPPKNLRDLQTIPAIKALVRRGVQLSRAKVSIETLVREPVSVHLPRLEGQKKFADEMAANGVHVVFLAPHHGVTSHSGG